ncbi:3-deoxy-manno-octulosonate cytidylyltransferase [Mesobaculum littorinae]|uniref:3-deoxy-manno-octulosonate cytidylyltransferase n=1 Tax=Mesobaculum littorinae TaxID=2486419 RepID=A0A438AHR1_9RHOB|nr:manno-octulosonate cytidylyltransferase [Mesobaculum littorinae]RVV98208.1 3-deoxy-manno-octulosonate cytidylyltransferase [Mesobaculum littorinae]
MRTVILIPARYASTRYPGKPLARLRGADGDKSLIQRSWEAAQAVPGVAEVHVATDDDRIRDAAQAFGASVVMTSPDCENGTLRCADAIARGGIEADLVVNLQGDAPLTPAWFVSDLIAAMEAEIARGDEGADVATPVVRCDATTYRHFVEDRQEGRVGGTTAVFDAKGHALYFSKEVIPYIDPAKRDAAFGDVFHHVGLYAYRPDALRAYAGWQAGPLERHEGLEQLRFAENGRRIACVEVAARGRVFWELNNPQDVARIERILLQDT